jgi:hypothetical protein
MRRLVLVAGRVSEPDLRSRTDAKRAEHGGAELACLAAAADVSRGLDRETRRDPVVHAGVRDPFAADVRIGPPEAELRRRAARQEEHLLHRDDGRLLVEQIAHGHLEARREARLVCPERAGRRRGDVLRPPVDGETVEAHAPIVSQPQAQLAIELRAKLREPHARLLHAARFAAPGENRELGPAFERRTLGSAQTRTRSLEIGLQRDRFAVGGDRSGEITLQVGGLRDRELVVRIVPVLARERFEPAARAARVAAPQLDVRSALLRVEVVRLGRQQVVEDPARFLVLPVPAERPAETAARLDIGGVAANDGTIVLDRLVEATEPRAHARPPHARGGVLGLAFEHLSVELLRAPKIACDLRTLRCDESGRRRILSGHERRVTGGGERQQDGP